VMDQRDGPGGGEQPGAARQARRSLSRAAVSRARSTMVSTKTCS
jgi:hypothetical protein